MVTKITATELAKNLSDVLNRTRYKGESFVIERGGEPVASIEPPPKSGSLRDIAARLDAIPRSDDKWADDLEAAIAEMRQPMPEPPEWPNS